RSGAQRPGEPATTAVRRQRRALHSAGAVAGVGAGTAQRESAGANDLAGGDLRGPLHAALVARRSDLRRPAARAGIVGGIGARSRRHRLFLEETGMSERTSSVNLAEVPEMIADLTTVLCLAPCFEQ